MTLRLGFVIVALAGIAMMSVKLDKDEIVASHESERLLSRLSDQRRILAQQDARLGKLTALDALRIRAEDMGVSMLPPGQSPPGQTTADRLTGRP